MPELVRTSRSARCIRMSACTIRSLRSCSWPLGLLPLQHAEAIFVGCGVTALAFAAWGTPLFVVLISAAAFATIVQGQWSLLLTASAGLPWLGIFWAAKPSLGLALASAYPRKQSLLLAAGIGCVSLALYPDWISAWLARSPQCPRRSDPSPWRSGSPPGAAGLAISAGPPLDGHGDHTADGLALRHSAALPHSAHAVGGVRVAAMTQLAAVIDPARLDPEINLVTALERRWPVVLLLVYFPALLMILRRAFDHGLEQRG